MIRNFRVVAWGKRRVIQLLAVMEMPQTKCLRVHFEDHYGFVKMASLCPHNLQLFVQCWWLDFDQSSTGAIPLIVTRIVRQSKVIKIICSAKVIHVVLRLVIICSEPLVLSIARSAEVAAEAHRY